MKKRKKAFLSNAVKNVNKCKSNCNAAKDFVYFPDL